MISSVCCQFQYIWSCVIRIHLPYLFFYNKKNMPKCCSFHNNNNRWRALYENWYENWDGSASEDTQFSNILNWIYWNVFMFKHAFRCVYAIPCVYIVLISFDTVRVNARRKCVFIIKLNTSNGKHWNAHENVLKRMHAELLKTACTHKARR